MNSEATRDAIADQQYLDMVASGQQQDALKSNGEMHKNQSSVERLGDQCLC
jgi:hypothetical protein